MVAVIENCIDMVSKDARWTTYGVTEENKIFVKVYAAKNQISVGEALNKIIRIFAEIERENEIENNKDN